MVDSPLQTSVGRRCMFNVILYKCMKKKSMKGNLLGRRLRKILLVMTLKIFILLCTFGSISAMGYSQDQKMSVNFHDEMLGNVLEFLKNNSDYEFVYRTEILGDTKVKKPGMTNVTLKENSGYRVTPEWI